MRMTIAGPAHNGGSGLRALLQRTDAVVHAAQSFQGSAEPLAPDGLSNQGELERAIEDYRRVRLLLD